MPTNHDLAVIMPVAIGISVSGFAVTTLLLSRLVRMLERSERRTRALAALVVQETGKIRDALRG